MMGEEMKTESGYRDMRVVKSTKKEPSSCVCRCYSPSTMLVTSLSLGGEGGQQRGGLGLAT